MSDPDTFNDSDSSEEDWRIPLDGDCATTSSCYDYDLKTGAENGDARSQHSGVAENNDTGRQLTCVAENIDTRSRLIGVAENVGRGNQSSTDGWNQSAVMSRMALNTNKAGMEGLDKDKINKIILEASRGSRFYENEQKKESDTDQRLAIMKQKLGIITERDKLRAVKVMDKLTDQLESARDLSRTIVHLDMDAFYAAVEMRDNPSLKNKPMAVGSMSMLSTSNYLARRFGVRAAMPGFIAKKLCPDLIVVPSNFDKYRKASKQVRDILKEYDPNFCPMSLDEAYFDLTEHLVRRRSLTDEERTYYMHDHCTKKEQNVKYNSQNEMEQMKYCNVNNNINCISDEENQNRIVSNDSGIIDDINDGLCLEEGKLKLSDRAQQHCVTFGLSDEEAVNEIRFRIQLETQLTASAGIAPNMMLAKVCSDKNKPNGQYKIEPTRDAVMEFVTTLPIRRVSGIGKVTEKMLKSLKIETCGDLFAHRGILHLLFSEISSHQFLQTSLGLGSTRVQRSSERKSISVERTFKELTTPSDLYLKLNELCHSLSKDLHEEGLMGRTITIKLKTVKFEVKSRSTSLTNPIDSLEAIYASASELLRFEISACQHEPLKLRLMGVRMSSLVSANALQGKQGTLENFFQKAKSNSQKLQGKDNDVMFAGVTQDCRPTNNYISGQCTESQLTNDNASDNSQKLQGKDNDVAMFAGVTENCRPTNNYISGQCTESQLTNDNASDNSQSTDIVSLPSPGQINAVTNGAIDLEGSIQEFVCPICNILQPECDLDKLNKHVDLCLNDKAIKLILLSEQEHKIHQKAVSPSKTSSSKRSCGSETSSAKRRRSGTNNQSTLEKFFKS